MKLLDFLTSAWNTALFETFLCDDQKKENLLFFFFFFSCFFSWIGDGIHTPSWTSAFDNSESNPFDEWYSSKLRYLVNTVGISIILSPCNDFRRK